MSKTTNVERLTHTAPAYSTTTFGYQKSGEKTNPFQHNYVLEYNARLWFAYIMCLMAGTDEGCRGMFLLCKYGMTILFHYYYSTSSSSSYYYYYLAPVGVVVVT